MGLTGKHMGVYYYGHPEKEVIPCYLTVLGELPE